jgi:hypothetical protein
MSWALSDGAGRSPFPHSVLIHPPWVKLLHENPYEILTRLRPFLMPP